MNKRILLVEDNPISREFLHEALLCMDVTVDIAASLAEAKRLAMQHSHALLLCDVHLPDAGPAEIFHTLTTLPQQCDAKIVAITAETGVIAKRDLKAIGYREVWGKPIEMSVLQTHVTRMLDSEKTLAPETGETGLWDEAAALRAVGGSQPTLIALRKMFLDELPRHTEIIEQAFRSTDTTALKAECHKLLAGCGFVGAAKLASAVRDLSEQPGNRQKMDALRHQSEKCQLGN